MLRLRSKRMGAQNYTIPLYTTPMTPAPQMPARMRLPHTGFVSRVDLPINYCDTHSLFRGENLEWDGAA